MLNVVSSKARGEASMSAKNGSIKLVAGNSNPALAQEIANWLHLPLAKASVRRFADNEIFVEVLENVRGSDAFIIQSTSFRSEEHTSELQSPDHLVCRLLLEKKKYSTSNVF